MSQDDEIYRQRNLKLSTTAAKEAAKKGVKCWVELSTGAVYKSDREPSKETDKLKPWLKLAKYQLEAEEELKKIEGCVAMGVFVLKSWESGATFKETVFTCIAQVR